MKKLALKLKVEDDRQTDEERVQALEKLGASPHQARFIVAMDNGALTGDIQYVDEGELLPSAETMVKNPAPVVSR
jgi:hypothetical protein